MAKAICVKTSFSSPSENKGLMLFGFFVQCLIDKFVSLLNLVVSSGDVYERDSFEVFF